MALLIQLCKQYKNLQTLKSYFLYQSDKDFFFVHSSLAYCFKIFKMSSQSTDEPKSQKAQKKLI